MKVKKYELVRIIDKLKSVVQKNTVHQLQEKGMINNE